MRLLPIWTLAIRTLAIRASSWPVADGMAGRGAVEPRGHRALRNQIYELQQQVQALQQQLAQPGRRLISRPPATPPPQAAAATTSSPQLLARVQTLEEQMRTLRGRVDQAAEPDCSSRAPTSASASTT